MQHYNRLHRLRIQTSVTQTDIAHILEGTDQSKALSLRLKREYDLV